VDCDFRKIVQRNWSHTTWLFADSARGSIEERGGQQLEEVLVQWTVPYHRVFNLDDGRKVLKENDGNDSVVENDQLTGIMLRSAESFNDVGSQQKVCVLKSLLS
jgi:hypothetical protein